MKHIKKSFPVKPALLLAASAVLLIGSTVGSTRAALTYYSENYSAQINMSSIGVSLLENGKVVSHRTYQDNGTWDESASGVLLDNMLGKGEKVALGKAYDEKLSVQNSGNIDTFVRVILTKSWYGPDGKDTTLSPELIDLKLTAGSGWEVDPTASTPERTVLYYTQALPAGQESPALADTIAIDKKMAEKVNKIVEGNTIRYVYAYDGYEFHLDAEVDAVQTHNAKDAIKSAWGVDVDVSEDETSLGLQ